MLRFSAKTGVDRISPKNHVRPRLHAHRTKIPTFLETKTKLGALFSARLWDPKVLRKRPPLEIPELSNRQRLMNHLRTMSVAGTKTHSKVASLREPLTTRPHASSASVASPLARVLYLARIRSSIRAATTTL